MTGGTKKSEFHQFWIYTILSLLVSKKFFLTHKESIVAMALGTIEMSAVSADPYIAQEL